jgi:hypothetical protein
VGGWLLNLPREVAFQIWQIKVVCFIVLCSESAFVQFIKLTSKLIEYPSPIGIVLSDLTGNLFFHEVGNRFSPANQAYLNYECKFANMVTLGLLSLSYSCANSIDGSNLSSRNRTIHFSSQMGIFRTRRTHTSSTTSIHHHVSSPNLYIKILVM